MTQKNKGFTLVELLVVIIVISILIGIFMTYGKSLLATAQDSKKKSNAEDVRTALALYYKDHEDTFPVKTAPGGVDVSSLSTELTSEYLNDQSVLQPVSDKYSNKYVSNYEGSAYALAYGLENKKAGTINSGSGVYLTNSSGIAGAVNVGDFVSPSLVFSSNPDPVTSGSVTPDFDTNLSKNTTDFSASFWIKPTDVSRRQYLLNQMVFNASALPAVTDSEGWEISLIPGTSSSTAYVKFTLCPTAGCSSPVTLTSTNLVAEGSWSHITFVARSGSAYAYDYVPPKNHALAGEPSAASLYFAVIVNGVTTKTTTACTTSCLNWPYFEETIKFGYGSTAAYSGQFDDLRLYNSYLTSSQVSTLYNSGRGSYGSCSTDTGVAYRQGWLARMFGFARAGEPVVPTCAGDASLMAGWRLDDMSQDGTATSYLGSYSASFNSGRASWSVNGIVPIGLSGIKTGDSSSYNSTGRAYVLTNVQ